MLFDSTGANCSIAEALGLDPTEIKAFTIQVRHGTYPRVTVEYGAKWVEEHPLAGAFADFELRPVVHPVDAV